MPRSWLDGGGELATEDSRQVGISGPVQEGSDLKALRRLLAGWAEEAGVWPREPLAAGGEEEGSHGGDSPHWPALGCVPKLPHA